MQNTHFHDKLSQNMRVIVKLTLLLSFVVLIAFFPRQRRNKKLDVGFLVLGILFPLKYMDEGNTEHVVRYLHPSKSKIYLPLSVVNGSKKTSTQCGTLQWKIFGFVFFVWYCFFGFVWVICFVRVVFLVGSIYLFFFGLYLLYSVVYYILGCLGCLGGCVTY